MHRMTISAQIPTYPRMKNQSLILNLPSEITANILTRLPTKTITTCKCVCKKWLKLISTPHFSKSHLHKSTPGLIVYLTQEDETLYRMFEFDESPALQPHDLHYKHLMNFDPNKLIHIFAESNLQMLCSVNGLLCLHHYSKKLDTLLICNPITCEFVTLPGLEDNGVEFTNIVNYGIGITATSFQYKVVRISHDPLVESGTGMRLRGLKTECMVYTLGARSWRNVEANIVYEYSNWPRNIGSFLNSNLHWFAGDENGNQVISCFDLEMELFKPFASPPFERHFPYNGTLLTVLGDCLCICDFGGDQEKIVIWVMTDYGVEESWTEKFVIWKCEYLWGILNCQSVTPLQVFENGDILILWEYHCLFYHCKESGTNQKIDLFEPDRYGQIDALPYTPSFLSLRNFGPETIPRKWRSRLKNQRWRRCRW